MNRNELLDRVEELRESNINKRLIEHYMDLDRYNSIHIEGNTLTLAEVSIFIERGITISKKPFKDYAQAYNYNQALVWLKESVQGRRLRLSELLLKRVHQIVTNNELGKYSGKYRDDYVFLSTTTRVPPEAGLVKELIDEQIQLYYKRADSGYTDFERIAMFKREFEMVHPFFDGNGRTGRVIMNLLLVQQGYPYVTISDNERLEYFNSLENDTFVEFLAELMLKLYTDIK